MGRHVGRVVAATAVVAATGTGAVLFGAGTAAAAPLIAGSCDTTVSGTPGQPVSVNTTDLFGKNAPTVALGRVPQRGSTTLSVPTKSLLAETPLLGGLLSSVTDKIGPTCDVTVKAVNQTAAPVQQAAEPVSRAAAPVAKPLAPVSESVNKGLGTITGVLPGSPAAPPGSQPPAGKPPTSPGNPPGTGQPGGNGGPPSWLPGVGGIGAQGSRLPFDQIPAFGALGNNFSPVLSPSALYGNLPFVTSGMFQPSGNSFGNQVPGFSPQFGMLGQDGAQRDVQNAGDAQALGSGAPGQDVGLPILVAVLALSGVTATLVRTWVLRRAG